MLLPELAVGHEAVLESIELEPRAAVRLMEMGLVPQSTVRMLGRSAGNVRVAVGATRIAVAVELARKIALTPPPLERDRHSDEPSREAT